MDVGRLGVVRRQENCRRKYMCILNDVIKYKYETLDQSLNREKFEIGVKHDKSSVIWKRKYVNQRVLQQCLKMRKESLKQAPNVKQFGSYGGKPLYSYTRDINRYLAEMHPRLRRQRKVKKALTESIERGKILDPSHVNIKMENYFKNLKVTENKRTASKEINEVEDISKQMFMKKTTIPPLRGIINSFYKLPIDDEEEIVKCETVQEDDNDENRNSEINEIDHVEENDKTQVKGPSKGLLKLPPIEPSKSLISAK